VELNNITVSRTSTIAWIEIKIKLIIQLKFEEQAVFGWGKEIRQLLKISSWEKQENFINRSNVLLITRGRQIITNYA